MAQQTKVLLIDDLDGGEAEETITFALDGAAYEIDLSGTHAEELRSALDMYIKKARRTGRLAGRRPGPAEQGTPQRGRAARNAAIRAWAKQQGIEMSERGRVPDDILNKWIAAGRPNT